MQQRQLRLGDILDDYCPRERRLTNHAVVAMVGQDVKQTRCTTCDAEHEYKHARVPRQRRKPEAPAALSAPAGLEPKRVVPEPIPSPAVPLAKDDAPPDDLSAEREPLRAASGSATPTGDDEPQTADDTVEEGPVHRPLIRATLPRPEGQAPPSRQAPDFTIRQPSGRVNRFRSRYQRGAGSPFHGNRPNGSMTDPTRGARHKTGRPPAAAHSAKRHGPGRKRSK